MKRQINIIILGVLITLILTGVAYGATALRVIEVVYNSVNLSVNGNRIVADNILYNGTTYVPLRAIAEALDKDVAWDNSTKSASINDKNNTQRGVITVDQVPFDIEILRPNSIGTVYMEATYKNNTNYPITSINLKILLKDKNETSYLTNYDTVMPGETSPKFNTFGPESQRNEDYQILTITVRALNTNGKTITVEYDTKLNIYEYSEY